MPAVAPYACGVAIERPAYARALQPTVADRNTIAGNAARAREPHRCHGRTSRPAHSLASHDVHATSAIAEAACAKRTTSSRALPAAQPSSRKRVGGAQHTPLHDPGERPDDPAIVQRASCALPRQSASAAITIAGAARRRSTRSAASAARAARAARVALLATTQASARVDSRRQAAIAPQLARRRRRSTTPTPHSERATAPARARWHPMRRGWRSATQADRERGERRSAPCRGSSRSAGRGRSTGPSPRGTRPPRRPAAAARKPRASGCRCTTPDPVHGRRLERPPRRRRARIGGERNRERREDRPRARGTPSTSSARPWLAPRAQHEPQHAVDRGQRAPRSTRRRSDGRARSPSAARNRRAARRTRGRRRPAPSRRAARACVQDRDARRRTRRTATRNGCTIA